MTSQRIRPEHYQILRYLVRWTLLVFPTAATIGSLVALFLWLLHTAISFRFQYPWLLYLLPFAGVFIHFSYTLYGKNAEKGNNLIMDEIHTPGGGVPRRMGPLVLATTVITHLFGGSAGREGTAVQIGGSMAQSFSRWFKLNESDTRTLLTAGIAAGFGAVFGTPLTGALFALEVLAIGRIKYDALLPCLVASIVGDQAVVAWGIHHTLYSIAPLPVRTDFLSNWLSLDILLLIKVIVASALFGLASYFFSELVHWIKRLAIRYVKPMWLIPVFGGITLILLTCILGKSDYLSLGVDAEYPGAVTIPSAFSEGGATTWSWFWKTIFTCITLGTGFKGGEVTPLFYIGATLGNTLSGLLNAPVSLFAALGFIAVFAGATNTPLACTIMGVELFGGEHLLLFAVACFTAYFFSGHSGIYSSQRIAISKLDAHSHRSETTLSQSSQERNNTFRQLLYRYSIPRFPSKKTNTHLEN